MKGYKAFSKDLKCRGLQYEVGQTYEISDNFCKNIADLYNYYTISDCTRICEVVSLGNTVESGTGKFCTDKIKIIREIKSNAIKHCNINKSEVGYCNSGDKNTGKFNSGSRNSGNRNSGDCNSGDYNSGSYNSGDYNSGNLNSGCCNWGSFNSGNYNSGYYNSGNYNCGVFNTDKEPTVKIFDKESEWTMDMWTNSNAYKILSKCPCCYSRFISEKNMDDEEKATHPEYKNFGGYIKEIVATKEDKQKWWDSLSEIAKQTCFDLPNFDAGKFIECLGIEHI